LKKEKRKHNFYSRKNRRSKRTTMDEKKIKRMIMKIVMEKLRKVCWRIIKKIRKDNIRGKRII